MERIIEKDLENFNDYLQENKNIARNAIKQAEVFYADLGWNQN